MSEAPVGGREFNFRELATLAADAGCKQCACPHDRWVNYQEFAAAFSVYECTDCAHRWSEPITYDWPEHREWNGQEWISTPGGPQ